MCVSKAAYFCGSWRGKRNIGPETQFTLRPSFFFLSSASESAASSCLSSRSFSSSWALKLHGFAISSFHCKKGQSHTAFSLHCGGLAYTRHWAVCNSLSYVHCCTERFDKLMWMLGSTLVVDLIVYIRKAITFRQASIHQTAKMKAESSVWLPFFAVERWDCKPMEFLIHLLRFAILL